MSIAAIYGTVHFRRFFNTSILTNTFFLEGKCMYQICCCNLGFALDIENNSQAIVAFQQKIITIILNFFLLF